VGNLLDLVMSVGMLKRRASVPMRTFTNACWEVFAQDGVTLLGFGELRETHSPPIDRSRIVQVSGSTHQKPARRTVPM
jgi:hypothetical protein